MASTTVIDATGSERNFGEGVHFRTDPQTNNLELFIDPSSPFAVFAEGHWIGAIRHE
jgi:hypothetical protein